MREAREARGRTLGPEAAPRALLAFVAAVPGSVLAWLAVTWIRLALADGVPTATGELPALLAGGATAGIAVALAATLLLGAPLFAALVGLGRVGAFEVVVGGAVVGAATALLLGGRLEPTLLPVSSGVVVGAAGGVIWWLVAAGGEGA